MEENILTASEEATQDQQAPVDSRLPSFAFCRRQRVLVQPSDTGFQVYGDSSTTLPAIAEVQRLLGQPFEFERLNADEFDRKLQAAYEGGSDTAMQMAAGLDNDMGLEQAVLDLPEPEDLLDAEDDAPIIRLINALLTEAIKAGASDIHIEPYEDRLVVRFRVDGVLREVLEPRRAVAPLLVSRIKVMAKLDIAEKRVPQDGRIGLRIAGRAVDVRVSTMPSTHGERVVMRLLDKQAGRLDLSHLGLDDRDLPRWREAISKPHGIVLVTGPTGSGKTTTLYAALAELNDRRRNIMTVEDPVEYYLDGVAQTQVNTKVDMTFARGLRAILRQDPDVVMVGEIRDLETAEIAVQASLTGHMVFSTLHTNSAVGAITRLRDMGIEPFLLSSSLVSILAQRLVRKLCTHCREPYQAPKTELDVLKVDQEEPVTLYHAHGCEHCNHTGYAGRSGIYELITVDSKMRELIHDGESEHAMTEHARSQGLNLTQDGYQKVLNGDTTLEEVLRVTRAN
ncbi:MAG: type II secretion system ATPase GspE [Gammaproteobacteria bacterium]|nr:type II secretion system ATPase GspE [Gammaproteobacteria bacterium]